MRVVTATELKAKCLAILDQVAATGETVTVTKRGRPVARISAATTEGSERYPQQSLAGTFEVVGDIVSPPLPAQAWEAEQRLVP
jgi:prevent-host-death family protein